MAMPKKMKAIRIDNFVQSLDEIQVSSCPIPSTSSTGSRAFCLIKITHVSPTHVDTLYARGLHQNNNRERGHVHPPFTLGIEFSGIVVHAHVASSNSSYTGPELKEGDKVWGTWLGAFAEYIVAPAEAVHLLPANLSLRDAAGLGASTAPVSYGALIRVAKLRKDETCLIHAAAGALGIVAVQIALAVGAKVICTVSSDAKVKVVEELIRRCVGSDEIALRHNKVIKYDRDGWEDRVKENSDGEGVSVVFDTVGLVEKSIRCCRTNARVVVVGFVGRQSKMEVVAMNRVLLKQIQLLGYRYGDTSRKSPRETTETWKGLNEMLNSGKIRPVFYRDVVGLERMPEALKLMTTRQVAGRIVVQVGSETEEEPIESNKGPEVKL